VTLVSNALSESVFARFAAAKIIPVLRSADAAALERDVARLAAAGLPVIEATTSTPEWDAVLAELAAKHPSTCFGVGTVTSVEQAQRAAGARAAFVVTPLVVPGLRAWADAEKVPLIEAGFTPTELVAAGAPTRPVKLFPASLGGPAHVRAMLTVLPGSRIIPTGGIAPGDVRDYLAAGAIAVGIGAALAAAPDPAALAADALGGRV
jgi:2-dehydro-3-deoxyphosphogluconate aldolase/(4S)-4-hydroxy-2-oxoglutarate aldolase